MTPVLVTRRPRDTVDMEWMRDSHALLVSLDLRNCVVWIAREVRLGR